MGKKPLKESHITNQLLLRGYAFKLYSELLLKRTKRDLEGELRKTKRNNYQIAICRELIDNLKKEIKDRVTKEKRAYKTEYKEKIEDTIKKAKRGDKKSIFRLVEWDKNWLFADWAKKKILIADGIDNRDFLEDIADAIKSRKNKVKTTHQKFYKELLYLKKLGVNFNDPQKTNSLREDLLNIYQSNEIDENDPIYKLLWDRDYFTKFLIRQGLKSGH